MNSAALYIRVSSTLQARDDRYGLERQEVEARAYAARLGHTLPRSSTANSKGIEFEGFKP